jgi:hypothetical protein
MGASNSVQATGFCHPFLAAYAIHYRPYSHLDIMQRTVVLGIGNTLLSDEGLVIYLLEYLQERHL